MIAINNDLHSHMIRLIVGLGNPGAKHESDRHNAGFWFIDRLASQHKQLLQPEKRFLGKAAKIRVEGQDIHLLTPDTYMNLSGESVGPLCRFHKIAPQEVLVVHDELDLKPGMARLKQGGGNGGHNGLKDIQSHLSSPQFWRLRFGIGHPRDLPGDKAKMDVADYVLKKPSSEEQSKIDQAIDKALRTLPLFIKGDVQNAMQAIHGPD
jgi:peptidyl-tRNA hydrolase, PTH1 family